MTCWTRCRPAKAFSGLASLTLGTAGAVADVGGNRGEAFTSVTYHGGRGNDQKIKFDGMGMNSMHGTGGGANRIMLLTRSRFRRWCSKPVESPRKARPEGFKSTPCHGRAAISFACTLSGRTRMTHCRPPTLRRNCEQRA